MHGVSISLNCGTKNSLKVTQLVDLWISSVPLDHATPNLSVGVQCQTFQPKPQAPVIKTTQI